MLTHASDPNGDPLTLQSVGAASHGTATKESDSAASYTPATNDFGVDHFSYTVSDGSATATSTVWVLVNTSGNLAPMAQDDAYTVAEDSSGNALPVLSNDSDLDADPLSIVFFPVKPSHGTVHIDGSQAVYTPAADYFGTDTFSYLVTDGRGGYDVAAVTLTITNVPDSVIAVNDAAVLLADALDVPIDVLANDANPDGLALTVLITDGPSHGTARVEDGTILYTPTANYAGADSLDYALWDGETALASASVEITVLGLNHAPVAVADVRGDLTEETPATIYALGNDSDPDGDSLIITAVTQPAHGTVSFTAASVTYTPDADYFGTDAFSYTIADPDGMMDTASVYVSIANVNDAPTAEWDLACVPKNGAGRTIDVLANDYDPDEDTLTLSIPGTSDPGYPQHGAITLVESGTKVQYVPATDYFGQDEFTYTVDDGHGGTATGSVSVLVYKLTIQVYPGYQVPLLVPARWGVPIGEAGTSVELQVMSEPAGVDFSELSVAWTGATVDPEDATRAYRAGDVAQAASVQVMTTDSDAESISETSEIVVVQVNQIVPQNPSVLIPVESGNADNAITGVSSDPATVVVQADVSPSTPDVSQVYDKLLVWLGDGSQGDTADTWKVNRAEPGKSAGAGALRGILR